MTRNTAPAYRWDKIHINTVNLGWTDTEGEGATQRRFHGAGDDWRAKADASLPMGKLGQATRSPTSWCSCCQTGPAWSPGR